MKDDMQKQQLPQARGGTKPHRGRKRLIVAIIIALICIAGAAVAAYILPRNSVESTLARSLQNTLKLDQVKFHINLTNPSQSDGDSENLTIDGAYKKGAGLSASATATITSADAKTTKTNKLVIDKNGTVYGNLSLYDTAFSDSKSSTLTPSIMQMTESAEKLIMQNNKGKWIKLDAAGLEQADIQDLQACALLTAYKIQSAPGAFQDFVSQLLGSHDLNVKKASSAAGTSAYTITVRPDKYNDTGTRYTKSPLYKALITCDKTFYAADGQSMNAAFKATTVTIKTDDASNTISSLSASVKNGSTLSITLSPASGVTITVPKVYTPPALKPGETPIDYLKRTQPDIYKIFEKNFTKIKNA